MVLHNLDVDEKSVSVTRKLPEMEDAARAKELPAKTQSCENDDKKREFKLKLK